MKKFLNKYWLLVVACVVIFSLIIGSINSNDRKSSLALNNSIQTVEPTETIKPTPEPAEIAEPTPEPTIMVLPTIAPILIEDDTNYQNNDIEEPSDEVVTVEDEDISYVVYITKTGEKYHSFGCQYLKKSCIEIDLEDAIARGYTPCSKCNP